MPHCVPPQWLPNLFLKRYASQSAAAFARCMLKIRRNTRHHSQVLCIECSVTLSFSVLGQRPIWCEGLSPCSVVCTLQRRSINCRRRNTGNQPLVSSVKTTGPPQCVPKPLLQLSSLIPHPSSQLSSVIPRLNLDEKKKNKISRQLPNCYFETLWERGRRTPSCLHLNVQTQRSSGF